MLAVLLPPAVMNSCLQTTDTIIMEITHTHTTLRGKQGFFLHSGFIEVLVQASSTSLGCHGRWQDFAHILRQPLETSLMVCPEQLGVQLGSG